MPDALEENKRSEPISCAFVAKPLGAGCDPTNPLAECTGVPAEKFRGAVMRPFLEFQMAFQFFRAMLAHPKMPQRSNGLSIGQSLNPPHTMSSAVESHRTARC